MPSAPLAPAAQYNGGDAADDEEEGPD
eukprot:COSAG05_NODE_21017_length_275_cov_0.585227_1_plen_26_part_10